MTILSDYEIEKLCTGDKPMLSPFVPKKTRELNGVAVPSFGLSSYGYDIRLGNEFKIPVNGVLNPMNPTKMEWLDYTENSPVFTLAPRSSVLAVSVEKFDMPPNVVGVFLGKSSYARCFVVVHMTPAEPSWVGHLTMEFTNPTSFSMEFYVGAGVSQVQFFKGARCKTPYGNGIYQGQTAVPVVGGGTLDV